MNKPEIWHIVGLSTLLVALLAETQWRCISVHCGGFLASIEKDSLDIESKKEGKDVV